MKTIYVGMALTQAPEEFRENFQHELKTALRTMPDIEVPDFIGLVKGTSEEVYIHDRSYAESADLCIFIADHPSIGMGMEIAYRQASGKPMMVFANSTSNITRMLVGMCEKENVPFLRYESVDDIVNAVQKELD